MRFGGEDFSDLGVYLFAVHTAIFCQKIGNVGLGPPICRIHDPARDLVFDQLTLQSSHGCGQGFGLTLGCLVFLAPRPRFAGQLRAILWGVDRFCLRGLCCGRGLFNGLVGGGGVSHLLLLFLLGPNGCSTTEFGQIVWIGA
ncbi:Uncharacterised protein [Mycobacteroides abscessus subsp. abscessus]|nr:Uncharacterised protein [Mycobacteroides abscessus subsp. abscessus]